MSVKYDKNVYLAMLAQLCYDDMIEFLEQMLKTREKDFDSNKRYLLSNAYYNSVDLDRKSLRTINANLYKD